MNPAPKPTTELVDELRRALLLRTACEDHCRRLKDETDTAAEALYQAQCGVRRAERALNASLCPIPGWLQP